MADNDYVIKPLEGLQSVIGLTPANAREEKDKRQQKKHKRHYEQAADPQIEVQQEEIPNENTGENKLDFRA